MQVKGKDVPSAELIVARFQQMRAEQRAIVGKIAEVEADRKKHIGVCVSLPLQTLFFVDVVIVDVVDVMIVDVVDVPCMHVLCRYSDSR